MKPLIDRLENPEKIQRQLHAFLPAALEIQETPPSPIGRAISGSIMLLFVLAVVWGVVGQIDMVAVAPGKIIPSGKVKTIQPLEIGIVKTIHVKDGQQVKAGDPLVVLDNTLIQADADQLRQKLAVAELQRTRQEIFRQLLQNPSSPSNRRAPFGRFQPVSYGARQEDVSIQRHLLDEQIDEYQYRKQSMENEWAKRQAEQDRIKTSVVKLRRTLPLIAERARALRILMEQDIVPRNQYLELEEERIQQEQDLAGFEAQYRELEAALHEIAANLDALKAETQKNNLREFIETGQQIAALKQELVKVRQRDRQQVLSAPIDGAVQQLAVHTVGGVVTPAQELMRIVPEQSVLEVEAYVLNKDIGFVQEGQAAEVKIDTFDFTKYGAIDGQIVDLSNDAVNDEKLGLVYQCRALIKKTQMPVDGKWVNLGPGMSVTVEIKTGKRRLIEYFLSPLLRYKQESLKER
ncbi:MAG: HlyD family type I secretion periplasmic adaptor subunit [Nitrospinae bacterium]|nr:HlyD family type I secretion periplasmic adaptor subunit [Nitrospinota bacterium]